MKKSMQKLTKGRVRDIRVSWFPELVDKSMFHNLIIASSAMWCAIYRKKHQDTSVLGHEKL